MAFFVVQLEHVNWLLSPAHLDVSASVIVIPHVHNQIVALGDLGLDDLCEFLSQFSAWRENRNS